MQGAAAGGGGGGARVQCSRADRRARSSSAACSSSAKSPGQGEGRGPGRPPSGKRGGARSAWATPQRSGRHGVLSVRLGQKLWTGRAVRGLYPISGVGFSVVSIALQLPTATSIRPPATRTMAAAPPPPGLGMDAALAVALAPQAATLAAQGAALAQQGVVLANIQVQLGNIQAALAAINPAGIAAAISQNLRAIEAARKLNHHDLRGVLYSPVPRADGTLPPSWPAGGFERADLVEGPIPLVDALLADYGLPAGLAAGGAPPARRVALAQALGTRLV